MKYILVLFTLFYVVNDAQAQLVTDDYTKGVMLYEDYLYDEAEGYLLNAANKGQGKAYFLLGEIYDDEYNPSKNDSLASESYRKGAELGDISSMVKWAAILLDRYNRNDSLEAIRYLNIAKTENKGEAFLLLGEKSKGGERKRLLEKSYNQGVFEYSWLGKRINCSDFSLMTKDIRKKYLEKYFFENPDSWIFNNAVLLLGHAWSEFCNYSDVSVSNSERGYPFYYKAISCKRPLYSYRISVESLFRVAAYLGNKESMMIMVKSYGDFGYFTKLPMDDWSHVLSQERVDILCAEISELRWQGTEKSPQELNSLQNYKLGAFFETDTKKAIMFLQEAVKQGNKQALLHLGLKIKEIDPIKSISYFWQAEEEGVVEAKYELYKLSKSMKRSSKNTIEACNIMEDAPKEQYTDAANMYTNAYRNGSVYVKETTWKYYMHGSGGCSGRRHIVYKLINEVIAECYYRSGEYDKVIEILNDSMVIKSPKGLTYLGLCYYHGYGVNVNREYGKSLLEKAAELKDADAMFALGNDCRKSGDYENAVHWYHRSAHFGNKDAMKNLALCYDRGLGVNKDSNKARVWMDQYKIYNGVIRYEK